MGKAINPLPYNTDKPSFDVYFRNYERLFGPLAGKRIHLLELGISQGGPSSFGGTTSGTA